MVGVGTCDRVWWHVAGCGGMWHGWWQGGWQGSRYVVGGQAYGVIGHMCQGWRHVAGCGGMWQGVGACGMGGGRVLGQVAEVWVCGRGSGLWCSWAHVAGVGNMWQAVGACGRVWEHVAWVVAGCGGRWQRSGYVVGGQPQCIDGDMWQGWGHVIGCGGMWQDVEPGGRGGGRVWRQVAEVCMFDI